MTRLTTFVAMAAAVFAAPAIAQTDLPFALDWKFEGPAAPYFHAIDAGYFAEAGLNVTISEGAGSLDAIPKVATGAFPIGFADINSLMRFLDQNPGAPVTAVMMIYDKPPFAVVGRASLGVTSPPTCKARSSAHRRPTGLGRSSRSSPPKPGLT
jgi:NitT/TauT family transport system substrate-binding protein